MNTNELNGTYRGKVVDAGLGKTSKGTEQVALLCQLSGEGVEGLTLAYYGYFTEKTTEHTIKALRTAGWDGVDLTEVDRWKEVVPSPPDVQFVIEQEEQQDEHGNPNGTRARVRWINAAGGIGVKERLNPSEAQSFAQRMKGKLLAFDQGNRGPKANGAAKPAARPTPPPLSDYDGPPF